MMIDFKYLFEKYKINCTGLLMCGGNTGQERYVYDQLQIPEVLWIEAIPDVFEIMKENLLPFKNQIAIKACISDIDGEEVNFNISNNEAQSSSFLELGHHSVIHPEVHYIDKIKLTTTRLDTLFNLLGRDISHINFLSGDLQGCELKMLRGLGKIMYQLDYVYLEANKVEVYNGCALVWQLDEYLDEFNFQRVETGDWVSDSWTDVFFVKRNLLSL